MKIILSDFFWSHIPAEQTSNLAALLRGKIQPIASGNLWQYVDSVAQWPGAAPLGLQHDMPSAPSGYWLRADPIYLQPGHNNVLLPKQHLSISPTEAEALITSLNALFKENGFTFYAATPNRWYMHCQQAPQVSFADLPLVLGQQIAPFLPIGKEALLWQRYLNEIQMLFYTHAINTARTDAAKPAISGVWFWGLGYAPFNIPPRKTQIVYSDSLEVVQQAQALGYQSAVFTSDLTQHCAAHAIWIIQALSHILTDAAWRDAMAEIDQTYLYVLRRALHRRKITDLELVLSDREKAYLVTTRRRDCWKFWRRRPLSTLFS